MTAKSLYLSQCHRWFQLARLHGFCSLVYSLQRSSWMGDGGGFPRDHSATHRKVRNFWERLVYGTAPHCVPLKCVSYLLGAMIMKSGHFEWEMRMTLMQMCLPLNDPIIRRVCDQLWNCCRGWYEFLIKSSNVLRCESNAHPIDVVICLWWVFLKRFR